jgi:hypothetical protein
MHVRAAYALAAVFFFAAAAAYAALPNHKHLEKALENEGFFAQENPRFVNPAICQESRESYERAVPTKLTVDTIGPMLERQAVETWAMIPLNVPQSPQLLKSYAQARANPPQPGGLLDQAVGYEVARLLREQRKAERAAAKGPRP